MRLWSLHPKYLDTKGLLAVWREALLAKAVFESRTKGYKNHPQLTRFKEFANPINSINQYLSHLYQEAHDRGYNFNRDKIDWSFKKVEIPVTRGQLSYEREHLLKKLYQRDKDTYYSLKDISLVEVHPTFFMIEGGIETWEKI